MAHLKQVAVALTVSVFTGFSAATLADSQPANADHQARTQWHQAILTGYQALADNARVFANAASGYCATPGPDARATTEQAWLQAFLAWQAVRFVDFGPVERNNLAWQFQFWPDPKNLVGGKARYLINSDEPVSAERVAESGVAVQGFPMAEYLLFDTQLNSSPSALSDGKACDLLVAVAERIEDTSETLRDDWQAFRSHYLNTTQYRDTTVRAGMAGLELLEERRLAQPMGLRGTGKRSVYVADSWRSGTSLRAAEATVVGLKTYFLPGFTTLLNANSQPKLAQRVEAQFNETLDNFPALRSPMAALLEDDAAFTSLQAFYVDVSQLATLVSDQAAVKLGVARGFNSSDGD